MGLHRVHSEPPSSAGPQHRRVLSSNSSPFCQARKRSSSQLLSRLSICSRVSGLAASLISLSSLTDEKFFCLLLKQVSCKVSDLSTNVTALTPYCQTHTEVFDGGCVGPLHHLFVQRRGCEKFDRPCASSYFRPCTQTTFCNQRRGCEESVLLSTSLAPEQSDHTLPIPTMLAIRSACQTDRAAAATLCLCFDACCSLLSLCVQTHAAPGGAAVFIS